MVIEGKNAVREALRSNVTIEKVYIQKDHPSSGIYDLVKECRNQKIIVQNVDKSVLDKYSSNGRHQGILAFATDFKYSELDDILANKSENGHFILILEGVEDPHNLGACIRVADCAGVDGIIIPRHRSCGVTDTAVKVSCGASNFVKVCKVGNVNDAIRELMDKGITVFAADMDGESIYRTNLTGDIAIVIGGEGAGVAQLTKKIVDGVIALPQNGHVNSLNASVACGIVTYEALRQRMGK